MFMIAAGTYCEPSRAAILPFSSEGGEALSVGNIWPLAVACGSDAGPGHAARRPHRHRFPQIRRSYHVHPNLWPCLLIPAAQWALAGRSSPEADTVFLRGLRAIFEQVSVNYGQPRPTIRRCRACSIRCSPRPRLTCWRTSSPAGWTLSNRRSRPSAALFRPSARFRRHGRIEHSAEPDAVCNRYALIDPDSALWRASR